MPVWSRYGDVAMSLEKSLAFMEEAVERAGKTGDAELVTKLEEVKMRVEANYKYAMQRHKGLIGEAEP